MILLIQANLSAMLVHIATGHHTCVKIDLPLPSHSGLWLWDGSLILTLMLLVDNLAIKKLCKKPEKMTEPLAHGYSSESYR